MSLRFRALPVLLLFTPLWLQAQIEDADDIFRELRALEGTWFMPQDRGDRLEIWAIEDDSTLSGRELRIKAEDGDSVNLQTMRIERRGDVITFFSTVRGQNKNQPVAYEMTLADNEGYLFENPDFDNPQKIRYRLLGNRELQVTNEGRRGSRTVTEEFVFEREFTPATMEFRLRGGVNMFTLRATGNFPSSTDPAITKNPQTAPRIGWELGTQFRFKGRGGFITVNLEAGLAGKSTHAKSAFFTPLDTFPFSVDYLRDVNYHQVWLVVAAIPEINLKRDGRFTILAGPYFGRLLFNKATGDEKPGGDNKLFDANNDFKKNDVGIIAGFQFRLSSLKNTVGSIVGLRANLGLADLDALYNRNCDNPAFCNGRIGLQGISLYYSFNLLGL